MNLTRIKRVAQYVLRLIVLLLCTTQGVAISAVQAPRIVVLMSGASAPYEQTATAFQEHLRDRAANAVVEVHVLSNDAANQEQIVLALKQDDVGLIYTLGSRATRLAVKQRQDRPILATLILTDKDLQGAANATGIVLEQAPEVHFQWLRRFVPGSKRVGVLYNPKLNQEKVDRARRAAKSQGLELIAMEVQSPKELPYALKTLSRRVDVLWGIPDQVVLSPQTAKEVLLTSFRNRIPFVGLSENWVKAGALYALDCDYADLGMQSGDLAAKLMRGQRANKTRPVVPRKVVYSLNLKTAQRMKLDVPSSLVDGAQQVFR